jgi:hypothetical protein
MGGHIYWYFTPYQSDINSALQDLRQQEFEAGRYNPVNPFPFDLDLNEKVKEIESDPGNYKSIEEASRAAMECGTRSILDIEKVADEPAGLTASPVPSKYLQRFFKTERPTRKMVEAHLFEYPEEEYDEEDEDEDEDDVVELYDLIDRGLCRYLILYDNDDEPSELLFVGYSWD